MDEIVLERHFDGDDRSHDEFPLLPFQVPPGTGRLHISYEVSHALSADKAGWEEGNIIDIGLFDPRGNDFPGGRGFRGWSGTARQTFTVGPQEATPGYLAGTVQPGTWHLLLGLYQLAPEGCDVRITIRPERDAGQQSVRLPCPFDPAPVASGPRWFRGDLHSHTHHSDGTAPLADLVAAAKSQGLDFVAVTEHNTVSHLPLLRDLPAEARTRPSPLLLIPGVEISTYHGHANLWPVSDWFDFRCWQDDQMRAVRKEALERGVLFSVNHPKDGGPPWEFGSLFEPDCVEVWGGPWFISNYQALAAWDRLLRQGQQVTAVGGSDKHQGPFAGELGWYEIGTPTTWVWAEELSVPAIVEGLLAGRAFISEGPKGAQIELTAEAGGRRATMGEVLPIAAGESVHLRCLVKDGRGCILRLVSARRVLEAEVEDDKFVLKREIRPEMDRYFRPEVIDPPEVPLEEEPAALMARALGNPVYLKEDSRGC
ncbi:MAG: CehA/McbA family metallohydrolase [Anaerolineae bacterium]